MKNAKSTIHFTDLCCNLFLKLIAWKLWQNTNYDKYLFRTLTLTHRVHAQQTYTWINVQLQATKNGHDPTNKKVSSKKSIRTKFKTYSSCIFITTKLLLIIYSIYGKPHSTLPPLTMQNQWKQKPPLGIPNKQATNHQAQSKTFITTQPHNNCIRS